MFIKSIISLITVTGLIISSGANASTIDFVNSNGDLDLELLCDYVQAGLTTTDHAQSLLEADYVKNGAYEIQLEEVCEL